MDSHTYGLMVPPYLRFQFVHQRRGILPDYLSPEGGRQHLIGDVFFAGQSWLGQVHIQFVWNCQDRSSSPTCGRRPEWSQTIFLWKKFGRPRP